MDEKLEQRAVNAQELVETVEDAARMGFAIDADDGLALCAALREAWRERDAWRELHEARSALLAASDRLGREVDSPDEMVEIAARDHYAAAKDRYAAARTACGLEDT